MIKITSCAENYVSAKQRAMRENVSEVAPSAARYDTLVFVALPSLPIISPWTNPSLVLLLSTLNGEEPSSSLSAFLPLPDNGALPISIAI
jgi:hypothetical protein